jgi:hypothetical protein
MLPAYPFPLGGFYSGYLQLPTAGSAVPALRLLPGPRLPRFPVCMRFWLPALPCLP